MRSLAACPNPWRNVLVSGHLYSSLPFLTSFLVAQNPQHVSLALDRHLDGKLKPTNDIRLRIVSSSRRWNPQQEMEMRKRVSRSVPHARCAMVS
jgi:hypothetical protein